MSSSLYPYTFNNMGNLGSDLTDQTQRSVQNTKFGTYTVSNYFSQNLDSQVQFATSQPGIFVGDGFGVSPIAMDAGASLYKPEQSRELERLQLFQRPFATVPYLGRGAGDPTIESQLWQGELVRGLKSTSTISEKNYIDYASYPLQDELKSQFANPSRSIEELAMNGWTRGGSDTRNISVSSTSTRM